MRKQRILICVMCILLCVFWIGCKKDEVKVDDNHIAAYTISYLTNEDTAKMAERLCEKIQDLCDTKMSVEADKLHMDEYVIYIGGEKLAGQIDGLIEQWVLHGGDGLSEEERNSFYHALNLISSNLREKLNKEKK